MSNRASLILIYRLMLEGILVKVVLSLYLQVFGGLQGVLVLVMVEKESLTQLMQVLVLEMVVRKFATQLMHVLVLKMVVKKSLT